MKRTILALALLGTAFPAMAYPTLVQENQDAYWKQVSDPSTITILLENAGYATQNKFGIFQKGSPGTSIEVFNGADAVGAVATLSISGSGAVTVTKGNNTPTTVQFLDQCFGLYLWSPDGPGYTFYSDTSLNPDGKDHLKATETAANTFEWAWEDLFNLGDKDYNDMVIKATDVTTCVPDGGTTLMLMGMGIGGLAFVSRRCRK